MSEVVAPTTVTEKPLVDMVLSQLAPMSGHLVDQIMSQQLITPPPIIPVQPKPQLSALQELVANMEKAAGIEATVEAHELMLIQQQERLESIDNKIGIIVNLFRNAATLLLGEMPVGEVVTDAPKPQQQADLELKEEYFSVGAMEVELSESSTRGRLRHVVDGYVAACEKAKKPTTHKDVWNWLYARLNEQFHYNVSRHKQAKEMYLDAVERDNQLDNLFHIANTSLLVPSINGAQA